MLKRFLPRTLLGRFILIIVTPLVLLQAVTAVVFYERHWRTIQRYQTGALAGEVAMLTHLLERDATAETQNWIGARALKDFNLVAVFNPGDTLDVTRDRGDGSIESDLRQALLNRLNRPFRLDIDWQEERVRINVATSGGVLAVEAPLKRVFSSTTYIFILWMVGAAVVLLVVALAFLRNQIRPVKRLATAMDEFGKGRDVSPLKPQGATEVRQAGTAFGRMQARIGRQITQRTEMLAGVSHDLKTVLTRMRLQVAMLGDKPGSKDLSKDIRDMEVMLEGYLAFARGAGGEATRDVRLGPLLAEAVEDAGRDGRKINLEIVRDITLPVRPNALKRCVLNLIHNARDHAENIWVRLDRSRDSVEITVDDDGPGIPAHQREEVFRPFARADRSRNLDRGGVGLGLTIARDVARNHGGDLTLAEAPRGGLRAVIRLPV